MPDSTEKQANRSQFENTDTISRFQYVNTGRVTLINSDGVEASVESLVPPAIPYSKSRPGGANKAQNLPENSLGVYAAYPTMSPKYARHSGGRLNVNLGGLARIYIPVSRKDTLDRIKASYNTTKSRQLYKVADQVFGLKKGGGDAVGSGYLDFVLMSVNQALDEKYQVTEVLEDNYVAFFFGQRAPMWTFSGALMNTFQDDWTMNMWRLYSEMGRGTRLAQRGLLMSIRYDSVIISGGMTRFQWDLSSSNELFTSFSFQFLVQNITPLRGSMAPPTALPKEIYKDFYNINLDENAMVTYDSVMPVVNQSGDDTKVNDQAAATSANTNPDAYVDDLYETATAKNALSNEATFISLFGLPSNVTDTSTKTSSNPARIPMREL